MTRRSGDNYKNATVHRILTNPIYYGWFQWNGKLYRGKHEPIVDKALYDRVQEQLNERGRRRSRKQKYD